MYYKRREWKDELNSMNNGKNGKLAFRLCPVGPECGLALLDFEEKRENGDFAEKSVGDWRSI
jgi:hypothetical protein